MVAWPRAGLALLGGGENYVEVKRVLRAGRQRGRTTGQGAVDDDLRKIATTRYCSRQAHAPDDAGRIADRPDGSQLDSTGRRERLGQLPGIVQSLRQYHYTDRLHC